MSNSNGAHNSHSYSINAAASSLLQWAERQQLLSTSSASSVASRLQLPILISRDAILPWLRAHPARHKVFFRARDSVFQVAAIGFSYRASGPTYTDDVHAHLLTILDPSDPQMRFYGAARFHNIQISNPSPEWLPYDGYTFVLPAVELVWDTSCRAYLAVNFYASTGIEVIRSALAHVVAPSIALSTADPTLMIPRAIRVDDLTDFPTWDKAMTDILSDITSHEYDKIVLVRQKRFLFHANAAPRPLHILAALAHQNSIYHPRRRGKPTQSSTSALPPESQSHTNAYLFCLQIDHDKAFLGCTPECLFKLDDRTVLTEALAATVRLTPHDDEQQALATLLNPKNVDEHRFVVDYVTAAMARCGFEPITDGPNVRRLPRIIHLATHISATLPTMRPPSRDNDVFRLLSELHPTPAVCGVPRDTTIARIAEIERFDRGLFAGPFGWFSAQAADFCVSIRSATVHGLCVTAYAGSGIVQASESSSEWEETELKMSAFKHLFSRNAATRNCSEQQADPLPLRVSPHRSYDFSNNVNDANIHGSTGSHYGSSSHGNGCIVEQPSVALTRRDETDEKYFEPCDIDRLPNLNTLWGCCCVEELCRVGVNVFFVSPGSRSAALAVGVARSRHAQLFVAHDERGAGYLAVGYARATGRAAALITSSGTAVANLLPAVVEAYMDELPMILLTADRPPELRDVGANQAIHQVGIFGQYVEWSKDVPSACNDVSLRNLLSDIDYAVYRSGSEVHTQSGVRGHCGPVHLNMMFREKLAPDEQDWDRKYIADVTSRWRTSVHPLTDYKTLHASVRSIGSMGRGNHGMFHLRLWNLLKSKKDGFILLGGGAGSVRNADEALGVYELGEALGWPIISDIAGGLRLDSSSREVVHYADVIMSSSSARRRFCAHAVLQIGERITSKRVNAFVRDSSAHCEGFIHVLITTGFNRSDEHFTVTHRVNGDVNALRDFVQHSSESLDTEGSSSNGMCVPSERANKLFTLVQWSAKVDDLIEGRMRDDMRQEELVSEPWCARVISSFLGCGRERGLFIGNSMPIRDFDMYGRAQAGGIGLRVVANRGASGIDGILSSGIGYAVGSNRDSTIVVGDMSFIHDINALHLLRGDQMAETANMMTCRVTIVVVNNGGGGIFSMLPIAKHESIFSPLFDTPHRVRFQGVCESFRVEHIMVETIRQLEDALRDEEGGHRVIEVAVSFDHGQNAVLHHSLAEDIAALIESLCLDDECGKR